MRVRSLRLVATAERWGLLPRAAIVETPSRHARQRISTQRADSRNRIVGDEEGICPALDDNLKGSANVLFTAGFSKDSLLYVCNIASCGRGMAPHADFTDVNAKII